VLAAAAPEAAGNWPVVLNAQSFVFDSRCNHWWHDSVGHLAACIQCCVKRTSLHANCRDQQLEATMIEHTVRQERRNVSFATMLRRSYQDHLCMTTQPLGWLHTQMVSSLLKGLISWLCYLETIAPGSTTGCCTRISNIGQK
jgi:hypothetical protein